MKTLWIKTAVLSSVLASTAFYAQNSESIPNLRPNDQRGINVFENNKQQIDITAEKNNITQFSIFLATK